MPVRSKLVKVLDIVFLILGFAVLALFTTVYQMPFRLDDVLHMEWAQNRDLLDAWHPIRGEIVRSVRPMFAATIWLLTHYAGLYNYLPWHITLVGSFLIALAFAGLTARYIARRNSALYFTTALYWLAFAPIVNVLFWYGDLTFTIELMFVAIAWYFGLKGLLEGRVGMFAIGAIAGCCAVMSKEPAILLVHGVWLGALLFRLGEFRERWHQMSKGTRIAFILLYALVVGVSLYILLFSPTKSNRFFSLSETPRPELEMFILDRVNYYSSILLSVSARLFLITPIVYVAIKRFSQRFGEGIGQFATRVLISAALAFLLFYPLWFALILLFGLLIVIGLKENSESRAAWLSLPFAICIFVIVLALLVTVALVKTQLNELAITMLVISGWAWSKVFEDGVSVISPVITTLPAKVVTVVTLFLVVYGGILAASPRIARYEQTLRDVRDVRHNANDAIKWSARNLPRNAMLGVTSYGLHGIASADDLTSKNDSTKIFQQYTFLQGYNRVYLKLLGRADLQLAYLEDSLLAMRALDSLRSQGNGYLFLQTPLDSVLFYGNAMPNQFLKIRDTLLAKFDRGPYPSEVWLLRP